MIAASIGSKHSFSIFQNSKDVTKQAEQIEVASGQLACGLSLYEILTVGELCTTCKEKT